MSDQKIRMMFGVDTAMHLLRPGARWEISNSHISMWDDPRPCPSWEEVMDTMDKIKNFEDSINTIWLPEQIEQVSQNQRLLEEAMSNSEGVN